MTTTTHASVLPLALMLAAFALANAAMVALAYRAARRRRATDRILAYVHAYRNAA